jgi:hypothetical protein
MLENVYHHLPYRRRDGIAGAYQGSWACAVAIGRWAILKSSVRPVAGLAERDHHA